MQDNKMDHTEELVVYLSEDIKLDLEAYARQKAAGSDHQLYLLSSALKKYFELGLMHWRRGDMRLASEHFSSCVKTYNRMLVDAQGFGGKVGFWRDFWEGACREEAFPAAAAYLSGAAFTLSDTPEGTSRFETEGYRPWFNSKLILACMGHAFISTDELERSIGLAKKNRRYPAPLVKLTEFHFEVLTGQWAGRAASDMLDRHSELYAGLKNIKGSPDLIHGEGVHNDRVVDWIFACILKRIGWSGRYLHAWPLDGQPAETGNARETRIAPTSYVALV
jgi:hypothetical protein